MPRSSFTTTPPTPPTVAAPEMVDDTDTTYSLGSCISCDSHHEMRCKSKSDSAKEMKMMREDKNNNNFGTTSILWNNPLTLGILKLIHWYLCLVLSVTAWLQGVITRVLAMAAPGICSSKALEKDDKSCLHPNNDDDDDRASSADSAADADERVDVSTSASLAEEEIFYDYCELVTPEERHEGLGMIGRLLCRVDEGDGGDGHDLINKQTKQAINIRDFLVYKLLGGEIKTNITPQQVKGFINGVKRDLHMTKAAYPGNNMTTSCSTNNFLAAATPDDTSAAEEKTDKDKSNNIPPVIPAEKEAKTTDEQQDDPNLCSEKRLFLLDTISHVQRQYLQSEGPKVVFGCLLTALLDLMDSEYGFIGECKYEEDGTMYLQTHAITNIAWNVVTRDFYNNNIESGLKFYNLDSLFGKVMTTQAPVISNLPRKDPRGCGVPKGHPPLNYFLGIPFFRKGGVMNGMVGIANKPGGFTQKDVEFLEPFTVTCGNLIHAYWQVQRNKELIEGLETKVQERTAALETLNRDLEQANKRVVQAAQAQLQHFACMSHEIRTPLNCIVGLSSLMLSQQQEALEKEEEDNQNNDRRQLVVAPQQQPKGSNKSNTMGDDTSSVGFQKLTPFQEESIRMIVTSGDLLLTVVNDVLDYSKLESGNVDIEIKPTSLQQVLHAVVHSIQMKLQEKEGGVPQVQVAGSSMSTPSTTAAGGGVRISTNFDMSLPDIVRIDGRRLQQILYNLLGNAVKFSPNGATVELKVQLVDVVENNETEPKQPEHAVDGSDDAPVDDTHQSSSICEEASTGSTSSVLDEACSKCPFTRQNSEASEGSRCPFTRTATPSATTTKACPANEQGRTDIGKGNKKKMLRFIVKDYGKGIEKENFDRIFKPFLQANAETERVYGGTGLGLAITSKLAKTLGGSIGVDSEVGKWSEFTVDLPFLETPVDVQEVSSRLRQTVVMLIDHQENEAWLDDNKRLTSILDHYEVAHREFADAHTMQQAARTICSGQTQCICFVPEDIYSTNAMSEFRQNKPNCVSLISFGPKYKTNGRSHHIRSIKQMLPSVLVDMLVRQTGSGRRRCSMLEGSSKPESVEFPEQSNPQDEDDSYRLMKVLIAEDNKVNQKVLLRMLKRLGVENVKIADNGRIACDMEAAESYDICLMDMQMPLMDGLEACREILSRPQRMKEHGQQPTHAVPAIVFVTAQVSSSFVAECEAAGSSDFLAKPFNVQEIEGCLQKTWRERSIA